MFQNHDLRIKVDSNGGEVYAKANGNILINKEKNETNILGIHLLKFEDQCIQHESLKLSLEEKDNTKRFNCKNSLEILMEEEEFSVNLQKECVHAGSDYKKKKSIVIVCFSGVFKKSSNTRSYINEKFNGFLGKEPILEETPVLLLLVRVGRSKIMGDFSYENKIEHEIDDFSLQQFFVMENIINRNHFITYNNNERETLRYNIKENEIFGTQILRILKKSEILGFKKVQFLLPNDISVELDSSIRLTKFNAISEITFCSKDLEPNSSEISEMRINKGNFIIGNQKIFFKKISFVQENQTKRGPILFLLTENHSNLSFDGCSFSLKKERFVIVKECSVNVLELKDCDFTDMFDNLTTYYEPIQLLNNSGFTLNLINCKIGDTFQTFNELTKLNKHLTTKYSQSTEKTFEIRASSYYFEFDTQNKIWKPERLRIACTLDGFNDCYANKRKRG